MMLAIHPGTREILVMDDFTTSGMSSRREMEYLIPTFEKRARITFAPSVTFEEARIQLRSLPSDALVLIHSFSTDRSGKSFSLSESTKMFTSAAKVPVYGVQEARLGHGIVGGYLLGGREHGRRAADIALRVLAGEQPDNIPVDVKSTARPMFDQAQLTRFGISTEVLPLESTIINSPDSAFEKYRKLALGAAAIMAILIISVTFLTASNIRRKRAEEALSESEERLRLALEGTTDGIWDWNIRTGEVYFSPRYYTMLGYEPNEFPASYDSWRQLLHPDDAELSDETIRKAVRELAPIAVEFRLRTKNGGWRWILGRGKVAELDDQGNAIRIVTSHTDITERKRVELALQESVEKFRSIVENRSRVSLLWMINIVLFMPMMNCAEYWVILETHCSDQISGML